jgi:hypothetical protein
MSFNYDKIFEILVSSIMQSFRWTIWKWLVTGSIGALIGTLTFGEKIFKLSAYNSILYGLIGLLILYIIRFILIFIKESLKYYHEVYRNSKYGDAIVILKDSFALTHYYRKTPGHNDKEFMKAMMSFCNNLREIFKNILNDECSVSIKVPLKDLSVKEHSILSNLTRDISHNSRDTEKYKLVKHTLIGNTAFTYVFNKVISNSKEKYYINNKVNNTENYINTSKECYENGVLPYNSELVIPIVPIFNESPQHYDCLGFICVDTAKKGAFASKYDIAIMEGVADGIYDLISIRNNSINKNQE